MKKKKTLYLKLIAHFSIFFFLFVSVTTIQRQQGFINKNPLENRSDQIINDNQRSKAKSEDMVVWMQSQIIQYIDNIVNMDTLVYYMYCKHKVSYEQLHRRTTYVIYMQAKLFDTIGQEIKKHILILQNKEKIKEQYQRIQLIFSEFMGQFLNYYLMQPCQQTVSINDHLSQLINHYINKYNHKGVVLTNIFTKLYDVQKLDVQGQNCLFCAKQFKNLTYLAMHYMVNHYTMLDSTNLQKTNNISQPVNEYSNHSIINQLLNQFPIKYIHKEQINILFSQVINQVEIFQYCVGIFHTILDKNRLGDQKIQKHIKMKQFKRYNSINRLQNTQKYNNKSLQQLCMLISYRMHYSNPFTNICKYIALFMIVFIALCFLATNPCRSQNYNRVPIRKYKRY